MKLLYLISILVSIGLIGAIGYYSWHWDESRVVICAINLAMVTKFQDWYENEY